MRRPTNEYEAKFYKAIEDIFVGAKSEGKGGFINLMKIKEGYYRQVVKTFEREVNTHELVQKHAAFKEELYQGFIHLFRTLFFGRGFRLFCEDCCVAEGV